MEFRDIVMQRYATKKFDGRKVPEAKMQELYDMIRFAPSAVNVQPWKIKVVTDQKVKEQLKPAAWDQEQITTCSHLLVFCANTDLRDLITRLERSMRERQIPDDAVKTVIGIAEGFFLKLFSISSSSGPSTMSSSPWGTP